MHFQMKSVKVKVSHNKCPCCIKNCYSNLRDNPDLVFHPFPKNQVLRAEWIKKCFSSEEEFLSQPKNLWVCSKHFKNNDYFKKQSPSGKFITPKKTAIILKPFFISSCPRIFSSVESNCCALTFASIWIIRWNWEKW